MCGVRSRFYEVIHFFERPWTFSLQTHLNWIELNLVVFKLKGSCLCYKKYSLVFRLRICWWEVNWKTNISALLKPIWLGCQCVGLSPLCLGFLPKMLRQTVVQRFVCLADRCRNVCASVARSFRPLRCFWGVVGIEMCNKWKIILI